MAEALFSPNWYRVAKLTPKLRAHAQIHRHVYRGQTWYVLQDLTSERFHRFSPAAYFIIGLMDGRSSVEQIWERALTKLGDDAVTQDEVIQLLGQLHNADVLQSDVSPDAEEMFRRRSTQQRKQIQRKVFSIFAWQIPLYDPEDLLNRFLPLIRPMFGWIGVAVWSVVVGLAALLAASHWQDLTHNVMDRVLLPENLLLIWVLFPMIKLVHEFGHACAVKAYGGEVHEMGVMILVLTPVPYVDASSSWAFPSKWQRFVVGGAGMFVEMFLASLAMFLWLALEPGVLRSICFNVMLIAGVTTVIFNANPLMRFDGYYMLADWLEIPNLRTRGVQYLTFLCEKYLFARKDAEPPESTPGERFWFVAYSVTSFFYRIVVIVGIFTFLGDQSLLLATIFAGATAIAWLVVPSFKIVKFLFSSPRIRRQRKRALRVSGAITIAVIALLFVVPVPLRTKAEGVVWVPDEGLVRAGTEGFVGKIVVRPGTWVKPGDVLVELHDIELATEAKVLAAKVQELEAKYRATLTEDKVKAQIVEEELRYAVSSLARAEERLADFTLEARAEGEFVLPRYEDLPGRFVKKGELMAHVVNAETLTVRTIVSQQDIDLVRTRTRSVDVRLADNIGTPRTAKLKRIVPSASDQLPSAALGTQGGGTVPLDPSDKEGRKAAQKYFMLDVDIPERDGQLSVGGRVFVRFDHGWEPLALQAYRRARQMFLSRFNV
jgi:putative peptide zinc metalloprotease protein